MIQNKEKTLQYEILFKNKSYYLVAIKCVYYIGEIMKEFAHNENNNLVSTSFDGLIVFDALLSSPSFDSKDRFYAYKCHNGVINFNKKVLSILVPSNLKKIANDYFKNHKDLLKNSFFDLTK